MTPGIDVVSLNTKKIQLATKGAAMAWNDNIRRLMGVHDLSGTEASRLLDITPQALSEWVSKSRKEGTRQPNVTTLLRVSDFFGIPADALLRADFVDLLATQLADPERFRAVERKIAMARKGSLRVVGPEDIPPGMKVTVSTGPAFKGTSVKRSGSAKKAREAKGGGSGSV